MTQHADNEASRNEAFDAEVARRRLEADKHRVQGLIESLHEEGLDQDAADQVGDLAHVTDPADQASETFEREKDVTILVQLEHDLAEIEAALQRLDEGSYGIDQVTGEPIAPERLEAYPVAHQRRHHTFVTVTLRLFAAAREAAGTGVDEYDSASAATVGTLLDLAIAAYGETFASVLGTSRVWVNGDEPVEGRSTALADGDEVAVLPPVSGGIA